MASNGASRLKSSNTNSDKSESDRSGIERLAAERTATDKPYSIITFYPGHGRPVTSGKLKDSYWKK